MNRAAIIIFCLVGISMFGCRSMVDGTDASSGLFEASAATGSRPFHDLDFEYSMTDRNPFWIYGSTPQPCAANYSHRIINTDRTSGAQSLAMTFSSSAACPQSSHFGMTVVPIIDLRGKTLHVSGDLKLGAGTPLYSMIYMKIDQASGTNVTANSGSTTDWTKPDWQHVAFDIVVPDDAVSAAMFTIITTESTTGAQISGPINSTVLFDNLSVVDPAGTFNLSGSTPMASMIPTSAQLTDLGLLAKSDALSPNTVAAIAADYSAAALVGLGEATHGTKEFQQEKVAVIRELVTKFGFRALSFEGDMAAAMGIDRYINSAVPKSPTVLQLFDYRWWKTADVLAMLDWLKDFNAQNPADPVHFYGFDIEVDTTAVTLLQKFCQGLATDQASKCSQLLSSYTKDASSSNLPSATTDAQALADFIAQMQATDATMSPWPHQLAVLLQQVTARKAGVDALRDRYMAVNVGWIQNLRPGQKQILWAHNAHIKKGTGAMGSFVSAQFGAAYKTLGFSFSEGDILRYNFAKNVVDTVHFGPAIALSMDGVFAALGQESLYVSPSSVNQSEFQVANGRPSRDTGSEGADAYVTSALPENFDGVVFFKNSHAIDLLQ